MCHFMFNLNNMKQRNEEETYRQVHLSGGQNGGYFKQLTMHQASPSTMRNLAEPESNSLRATHTCDRTMSRSKTTAGWLPLLSVLLLLFMVIRPGKGTGSSGKVPKGPKPAVLVITATSAQFRNVSWMPHSMPSVPLAQMPHELPV